MTSLMANQLFMAGLDHPSPSKLGVIAAAQTLGSIPGVVPAPWMADRFGRRKTLAVGYFLEIVGALVQTFAVGGWNMLGGRFLLGFGVGITTIAGSAYTAEIAHPRNRAQTTALIQTCFFVGSIVAAWLAFGCLYMKGHWSWKTGVLFQIAVPLYVLISLPFVPESPRWLVAKGRDAEAHEVLAKYHANGDANDELVLYELEEIKEAIAFEQRNKQVSYTTFFKTKGNRHRLLILLVSVCSLPDSLADVRLHDPVGRQWSHLVLPCRDPQVCWNHSPCPTNRLQRRVASVELDSLDLWCSRH